MKQSVPGVATESEETADNIVASELLKLQNQRKTMKDDNQAYLESHPELSGIIDKFVSACVSHKPNDIVKFGAFFFSDLRKTGGIGPCPVIFAGPSGVGKGTLVNKLMAKFPNIFGFCVSHTTRAPRPGEEDGIHYNFVTKAEMEEAIDRGEFVEYAKVHSNIYGTSFKAVEKVRTQGKVCILDIDIQGVQNVKKSSLDCKYVFINPPSIEELEKRLRGRGTETDDKIQVRIANATGEMEFGNTAGNFDSVITNNDIDATYTELVKLLQGWYPDLDLYIE